MAKIISFKKKTARLVLLHLVSLCLLGAAGESSATDLALYSDSLAAGWQNWSWGATVDLASHAAAHSGSSSISVALDGWGALYMHTDSVIDLAGYDMLSFWINGGSEGGREYTVAQYKTSLILLTFLSQGTFVCAIMITITEEIPAEPDK